jgi:hypothetical protein
MTRKWLLSWLLLSAFFSVSIGLHGQTVQGVITGTITDPSNAVVAGATVTITNIGTAIVQTETSGSNGAFRFSLVPPGTYNILVSAPGFGEEEAKGVVVEASQTVPFSAKLSIASAATVVEVTGASSLVQTESSDLSTQVDNATIQNMALVDRDVFAGLPFLAPSVMPGLDGTATSGGARESGTSYLLNGGEDNDNFGEGGSNIHPPLESVQDFSIVTNNMTAQYGRGMGAVVTANQKSGSNSFHGVVYEFNRNALLNANDWFYNRDYNADQQNPPDQRTLSQRPKYIRNQFGGEVEGPIIKDKTFFSFAYDRLELKSGSTSANNFVPTSAALAYVKANGSPLAQAVITAAPPTTSDQPCPGDPGTGAGTIPVDPNNYTPTQGLPNPVGCLSFFDPINDTVDAYYGRVDHTFGAADRVSFIANLSREVNADTYGGGPLTTNGPIAAATNNHFHNMTLTETHTFGPHLLNEATVSQNRHYNVFVEGKGEADTVPEIIIDNGDEAGLSYDIGGSYEGGQLENFTQDRWAGQDNLSWTKGGHSFKFGGANQYGILYRNWDLGLPGYYEFGELSSVDQTGAIINPTSDGTQQPDGTIAALAPSNTDHSNFSGDYPYYQETSINPSTGAKADAYRHYVYHDWDWFVQDDWKITPKLTLNLGVRWDRYGAPSEVHGIMAQFTNLNCNILDPACLAGLRVGPVQRMWKTQNNDYAPRLGFAWDPMGNGKMAIRGGYGIFYDRIFDNIWSNSAWNPPFYALADFNATGTDEIYYSNPASIGTAYNPNGPCGQIPYASSPGCAGKRVSLRTMDVHMHDSSGQNLYVGIEHEVKGDFLLRVNYQAELGRHLPMLENLNRVDGSAANSSLKFVYPNALYNGFNYRSNSVSSSYHALVLEAQKRMSHGLQFQTSYDFSKLLDVNSELFAGCSTIGAQTAPYYYTTNKNPRLEYGRGAFDHRGSYKFSTTYELPFLKGKHGLEAQALGGWHLGSFFQFYTGHPVDVWDGRGKYAAKDLTPNANPVLDASGIPYNLGGDYNLDGTANDRPVFVGNNLKKVYGGGTPANGIFKDNNLIGCGASWVPSNVDVNACNNHFGSTTPNTLFETPPYPSSIPTYERFGTLGRDVFVGPSFAQWDLSLGKEFEVTERARVALRAQAQNLANHPNFDGVTGNLGSGTFGEAQYLEPSGTGEPKSRVMSIGARVSF